MVIPIILFDSKVILESTSDSRFTSSDLYLILNLEIGKKRLITSYKKNFYNFLKNALLAWKGW